MREERPLDTLDWLVGDWVNEDEQRSIEFSCHFTKNGAFLVRSFRIVTAKDVSMSDNLTQEEAPALLHQGPERSTPVLLVRLQAPADKAGS